MLLISFHDFGYGRADSKHLYLPQLPQRTGNKSDMFFSTAAPFSAVAQSFLVKIKDQFGSSYLRILVIFQLERLVHHAPAGGISVNNAKIPEYDERYFKQQRISMTNPQSALMNPMPSRIFLMSSFMIVLTVAASNSDPLRRRHLWYAVEMRICSTMYVTRDLSLRVHEVNSFEEVS